MNDPRSGSIAEPQFSGPAKEFRPQLRARADGPQGPQVEGEEADYLSSLSQSLPAIRTTALHVPGDFRRRVALGAAGAEQVELIEIV